MSTIGMAEFGYIGMHEAYIDSLRQYCTNPVADTIEYLKRDIANLALGNPDNHGQNSAPTKREDGTVALSLLFDFAPMKLAREGVIRSTRWAITRDSGRDNLPDWNEICTLLFSNNDERQSVAGALYEFAERLQRVPRIAKDMGAPPDIVERAMSRYAEIAQSVQDSLSKD